MKRRHFLMAGGLLGAGLYINERGLRYPRLSFEPDNPATHFSSDGLQLDLHDLIKTQQSNASQSEISLRAIAPEPSLVINGRKQENKLTFNIGNISAKAILQVDAATSTNVHERISGINRVVEIAQNTEQTTTLTWNLPDVDGLVFAAIGDSGGGSELDWCLTRAQQLNADFLLHLGDFNYGDGEYDRAIEQFNKAPMPVYVSIGNHDFNDSGLIYQQFLDQIGLMNHSFVIAGTRFINVDTAVNFFPAYAGNRGELMHDLIDNSQAVNDHVVFTHKPFVDSRDGFDHDISGVGEKAWLRNAMQQLGANDLLCGHVHHNSERDFEGIHQWTTGEGLGHEDLVNQQLVSKILLGTVSQGQKVSYQWHDLNMPWTYHQSHTHAIKLREYQRFEQLEWYQQLLPNNRK